MMLDYLKKEFRLQRPNLQFAGIAVAIESLLWILAGNANRVIAAPNYVLGELVQAIHYGILGTIFLLLIPFFFGIAAGTGDRDAGVMDWCMSLPAPRWKQWLMKGFVASLAACVFAGSYVVAGEILIARLSAHGVDSILGANRETFETLSWRGISPIWYMPWFTALGMFAGSVTRSYYRAFVVAAAVGLVAAFAPFLMDPMGLTFALPASRPGIFEKPWIHILHLLGLAAAAMAVGLRNYRFELPRPRRVVSGAFLWVLIANVAAMAVIWKELRIPDAEFRGIASADRAEIRGIKPLFQHYRISTIESMVRIPLSNSIAMTAWLDSPPGGKVYKENVKQSHRGLAFEVDVAIGTLTQYPNAAGTISGMDRKGRFFELAAYSGIISYGVALRGTPFFLASRTHPGGEPFRWMRWTEPEAVPMAVGDWGAVEYDGEIVPGQYFQNMFKIAGGKLREGRILIKNENRTVLARSGGSGGGDAELIDVYGIGCPKQDGVNLLESSRRNSLVARSAFYCVSPDERWFAAVGYDGLPLVIKSADDATSYRLELKKPLYPLVGLQTNNNQFYELGARIYDLMLPHPTQVMHVSPGGRYLAYYGFGAAVLGGARYEFGVLDLTNGIKNALIEGNWSHTEQAPVRPNWIQYLPMAWSKDGILACLTKDGLSFFREEAEDPGFHPKDAKKGELRAAGELDLKEMWPMVIGTLQAPTFWDEDTLLLFGSNSLWRVELRETNPELFASN